MKRQWPQDPPKQLSPEAIILWLEGHRRLMFEVWKNNPNLYEEWKRINSTKTNPTKIR